MNVLLVTDKMDAGGAETHLVQLALGLRALGAEVTLLSGGGFYADQLEQAGISQIRLAFSRAPHRLLAARRALRKLLARSHFDVVHAHARLPAFLLRGLKTAKGKTVVTVHAKFRISPLLRRICFWGDRSIAVCEDLRSYLCDEYNVPAERITVITNGIDGLRFSPSPEKKALTSPLRMLFASRLDGDCSLGAELLCAAAPRLQRSFPDLQITIAGGGSERSRIRALAEAVNRALPTPILNVAGWVADMPALMREQDVFVGVSRAAMEAAACGCAVVLCGNEGYLGILNKESASAAVQSNFCCRGAPIPRLDQLIRDLEHLLRDTDLRAETAREGRELINSRFGAEQICRETYALYHRLILPPPRVTVTIGGYFGCGNVGDDAILSGFLELLHMTAPDVRVLALTGHPRRDRRRFGIPCYGRKNPIAIRYALARSSVFFCGGGSLLQNVTSRRSLYYYLSLLRLAQRKKRTTLLYSAGIGPLLGERTHRRVLRVLRRCRYIGLRDSVSLRYLRALGIDASRLHLGGDPALWMPAPPSSRGYAILKEHGVSTNAPLLGVILHRTPENTPLLSNLMVAIRTVCRRNSLTPIYLALDQADLSLALQAAHATDGHSILHREPADVSALLSECRAVVTMRLHGLVLASVAGVTALGVPADPRDKKIPAFAAAIGQPLLSPTADSAAELTEALENILKCPIPPRFLADSLAEQRKKVWKDLANIVTMLYNKGE